MPFLNSVRTGLRRIVLAIAHFAFGLTTLAWVAIILAIVAALAFSRPYFNYGTETDYIFLFAPEAERALSGGPLKIQYHPPLYAVALAPLFAGFGDWFRGGLFLSVLSSGVTAWISFELFKRFVDRLAALAACLAVLFSGVLLSFSAQATSDVFFLMLYQGAILAALIAIERRSVVLWAITGALIGLCLLTRSNALTLCVLMAAPLLLDGPLVRRLRFVPIVAAGVAAPMLVWAIIATVTGSPFMPAGTVDNLAMTFFGEGDRLSRESIMKLEGRFSSVFDVFLYDPITVIKTYLVNLFALPARLLGLIAFPLSAFIVPGLVLLMLRARRELLLYILIVTLTQVALVNLKTFEIRFYLFLVPLLAVAVLECWRQIYILADDLLKRELVVVAGALCAAWAGAMSLSYARYDTTRNDAETRQVLAADIPFETNAVLIGRKRQVAYHLGVDFAHFLEAPTLGQLEAAAADLAAYGPVYFHYGSSERSVWTDLSAITDSRSAPDWLTPVADVPGEWTIYRVTVEPSSDPELILPSDALSERARGFNVYLNDPAP